MVHQRLCIGAVSCFLGLQVHRDYQHGVVYLHQRPYIDRLITQFAYDNLNGVATPWSSSLQLPAEWQPEPDYQYLKITAL